MITKSEPRPAFPPLIVHERGELTGALVERRHQLGLTGEEVDDRAGFSERYTAKLETPLRPQGKLGFRFEWPTEVTPSGSIRCSGMAEVWMQALGLRLVLLDEPTARAIGAVPAPTGPRPDLRVWGGNVAGAHAGKRSRKGMRSTMTIQAYEAADRARVAAISLRAAVTDHPWLNARPTLKAEAEAIERRLLELSEKIGEAA